MAQSEIEFLVRCCMRNGRTLEETLGQANAAFGHSPQVGHVVRAEYKPPTRSVKIRQHNGNLSIYRADDPALDTPEKVKRYGTLIATRFASHKPLPGDQPLKGGEWWNIWLKPNERSTQREVHYYEAMPIMGEAVTTHPN